MGDRRVQQQQGQLIRLSGEMGGHEVKEVGSDGEGGVLCVSAAAAAGLEV